MSDSIENKSLFQKEDTRRKILIGSCLLSEANKDNQKMHWLKDKLDRYLVREKDRQLFGLDQKPQSL